MHAHNPDDPSHVATETPQTNALHQTHTDSAIAPERRDAGILENASPKPKGNLKPDTLLGGLAFLLMATVLQRTVGLVRSALFFRWMDPSELGLWDVSYGFLLVASPLISLGVPGTLPRYFERFRRRGNLPTLILQIIAGLTAVAAAAAAIIILFCDDFGNWLFGRSDQDHLVVGVGLSLLAMAWFGIAIKFFVAMRLQRMASLMNFVHSALFALIGCLSLATVTSSAISVLFAHAFAMVLTLLVVSYWLVRTWRTIPVSIDEPNQSIQWGSIGLFSISLCLSTVLSNVFAVVDRYMIVHYSGLEATASLAMVGQYSAARIVPMLMISVATGFAFQMLAHLTYDWELGRRELVGRKIDFTLRAVALFSFIFSTAFLLIGPWVFSRVFDNKYDEGLQVLGITLTSGILFCMFSTAKLHLWCFEKAWLAGLISGVAAVVNAVANLILLPRLGLAGAATANCIGVLSLLLGVFACSTLLGMRFKPATFLLTAVPFTLFFGSGFAVIALVATLLLVLTTNLIFDGEEKRQMLNATRQLAMRVSGRRGTPPLPSTLTGN